MRFRRPTALALCALALLCDAAHAGPRPKRSVSSGYVLQSHLDRAMAVDTQRAWLLGQRAASSARHATADSITPGSPYVAGSARGSRSGNYTN
jgi:outer membrane protein, heavy metal efflux system